MTVNQKDPLEGMTQEKWGKLSEAERKTLRSVVNLSPQLVGKEGCRVEVMDEHGERRRFIVGRSTGWKPCHIELKNRTSSGGGAAAKYYKSVRHLETVFHQ